MLRTRPKHPPPPARYEADKPAGGWRFSYSKLIGAVAATISVIIGLGTLTGSPSPTPTPPLTPSVTPAPTQDATGTATAEPTAQPPRTERPETTSVAAVEETCQLLEDEALRGPMRLVGYDGPQAFANAAERLRNLRQGGGLKAAAEHFDKASNLLGGTFAVRAAEEEAKAREILVADGAGRCAQSVL